MNISNPITSANTTTLPALDAFQQAAQKGDWVHVSRDGTEWKVLGTGTTPSQRSVAWIEPEADATSAFVSALEQSFSKGIQASVVRELGLGPAPGRPLSSRTVMQAIDMAQTSQQTLRGVDFLTQLTMSAAHGASGFKAACEAVGVSPTGLDAAQCAAIDAAMQQRFESAIQAGASPIAMQTASGWLQDEIRTALAAPT